MRSAEIIVLGGGVIGLATAYELHKAGADFLCLEGQESFGQAQSVGVSRIFRHWHDDPDMIQLAQLARDGWEEWERELDSSLLLRSGQIIRASKELAGHRLLPLSERGLTVEGIDSAAATQMMSLLSPKASKKTPLWWTPDAAAIKARDCLQTLHNALGERFKPSRTVTEITPTASGFTLSSPASPEGEFQCERLLIAAGAQTRALAEQIGIQIPVSESWHARVTFSVRPEAHRADRVQPCWSDWNPKGVSAYGLPIGRAHYAVGLWGGPALENPNEIDQREKAFKQISRYAQKTFPGLDIPRQSVLCLASQLRERDADALDLYTDSSAAALAIAGGNLFKFAPVLGSQLAQDLRG